MSCPRFTYRILFKAIFKAEQSLNAGVRILRSRRSFSRSLVVVSVLWWQRANCQPLEWDKTSESIFLRHFVQSWALSLSIPSAWRGDRMSVIIREVDSKCICAMRRIWKV